MPIQNFQEPAPRTGQVGGGAVGTVGSVTTDGGTGAAKHGWTSKSESTPCPVARSQPGALFETYTAKLWALVDSIPVTEGMRATAIENLSGCVTGGAAYETDPVEVERLVEGVSRLSACPADEAKLSCVHEILKLLDVRHAQASRSWDHGAADRCIRARW